MRAAAICVVVWALLLPVPPVAMACRCGDPQGPVVAQGTSPHGVRWRILAHTEPHQVAIDFAYLPPGYDDAGYGIGLPLPLPTAPWLTANVGSEIDPFAESDISGVTTAKVVKVIVRMHDHTGLVVRPRLAPRAVREAHPSIRTLRYFDAFYRPTREPRLIIGLDAHSHILVSRRA
jgi:hypothetical protein